MCDKCKKIDEKIAHYRGLASRVTDRIASDGIKQLIEELLAEKNGVHPEVHLVRVTTDDGSLQIWMAVTNRDEAVDRVLDVIPEGWAASLVERRLSPEHIAELDMKPGEVRQQQLS
ncbi:hypothetical protein [Bradyrhizobium tropiciagri]|uniref:hypothetical protein n=1 Tax=Bradyrhizobium tropiciagri TaxID=312253 RepID=UPI00067E47B1|nr:hypothetical protein [Bradyrhizobium tropiciagri]